MKKFVSFAKKLAVEDQGASMVEYAIGAGFIAAVLVVAVAAFTGKLSSAFGRVGADLDAAQ